jgi:hypothetical protein
MRSCYVSNGLKLFELLQTLTDPQEPCPIRPALAFGTSSRRLSLSRHLL